MSNENANDQTVVDTRTREPTDGTEVTENATTSFFTPSVRQFPWVKAGLAGGVTFLVEYLAVTALIVVHPGLSTAADTLVEQLKSYGLILFNAHAVPITVVAEGVQYQGPTRFNLVTDTANPVLPAFVYLAIPVLTLLIAGALFEWFRREGDEGVLEGSALVGTGLVSGYLVVVVLASFAVATTTTFDPGSVTEGVDKVFAFAAAIAYPLVVGSVGALVVRTYRVSSV